MKHEQRGNRQTYPNPFYEPEKPESLKLALQVLHDYAMTAPVREMAQACEAIRVINETWKSAAHVFLAA